MDEEEIMPEDENRELPTEDEDNMETYDDDIDPEDLSKGNEDKNLEKQKNWEED